jgi:hypothetical protein
LRSANIWRTPWKTKSFFLTYMDEGRGPYKSRKRCQEPFS